MTTEAVSWAAGQPVQKRMIRLCCPKPLCEYPVPACCHGNAVRDLNTSPCPLPSFLLSSSFHSSSLSPRLFCQSEHWLSPSLSHVSSGTVVFGFFFSLPPSPCLVLSAKWHFTSGFVLLIPHYFASCDSVKALVKHAPGRKVASTDTHRQITITCCVHIDNYLSICSQMHARMLASTHTSNNAINESQRSTYSQDAGTAYTCWQSAANRDLSFSAKASSSSII